MNLFAPLLGFIGGLLIFAAKILKVLTFISVVIGIFHDANFGAYEYNPLMFFIDLAWQPIFCAFLVGFFISTVGKTFVFVAERIEW